MALWFNLLAFILSALVIVIAGSLCVRSLTKISTFLRISEFVIGFIIMAISTSLPELFVGISSALAKNSALLLGTIIGSNISDLALIAGITILVVRKIDTSSKALHTDSYYMFFIALLPLILMLIGKGLSRIDGVILILVFTLYMYRLFQKKAKYRREIKERIKRTEIVAAVLIFIASLVLLFFSAEAAVRYGSLLAIDLFLPPIFIGLFFIALGTSLPELVFEITAVRKKHPSLALGDLIGSVIVNSTLVLGITALIFPITANFFLFLTSSAFLLVIAFTFITFLTSGGKLDWREGVALVLMFMLFLLVEINLGTLGI